MVFQEIDKYATKNFKLHTLSLCRQHLKTEIVGIIYTNLHEQHKSKLNKTTFALAEPLNKYHPRITIYEMNTGKDLFPVNVNATQKSYH